MQACHHPLEVAVDRCRRQVEGDGGDGRRRVGADAGQFAQARFGLGKAALEPPRDDAGTAVQVARPGVVAEPLPGVQNVVEGAAASASTFGQRSRNARK